MTEALTAKYSSPAAETTACTLLRPSRHVADLLEDARDGLLQSPRSLPPKYFYDDTGSDLFERITETREYYPTRTEDTLLTEHAEDIIRTASPDQILELGSGSSRKTRRLFDACQTLNQQCSYAPMDVCEAALLQAADELRTGYPWLPIDPIVGDYHAGLTNLPAFDGRRLFVFLGSTIGNFEPPAARDFLAEINDCMRRGDKLLLGADRVKDKAVLEAAYNDSDGITAAFNLNVLRVLNRELKAHFDPEQFQHHASYNAEQQRIEMRLVSKVRQHIPIDKLDAVLSMDQGEPILTEVSHKFTPASLQQLLLDAGLVPGMHYQADNQYFSLLLAEKRE